MNQKIKVARRIKAVAPSATLVLDKQAKDMIARGEPVVNLTAGELDFAAPLEIRKKVAAAASKGFNTYTPTGGLPEVKKLICRKLEKENGLRYDEDGIVVTNGAKQSLFNIFQVIAGPGDQVIIPRPYWVSYSEQVKLAGARPVFVPAPEDFGLDADAVLEKVNARTRAVMINTPNNPTGRIYSTESLKKLARGLRGSGIWLISDEIYEKLAYGKRPVSPARFYKGRTIIVNGFSKTHAITGWRVGYTAADKELASLLVKMQSHSSGNVSNIMQMAAIEALKTGAKYPKKFMPELKKRRQLALNGVSALPGSAMAAPDAAFYVFFRVPGLTDDSDKFCQNLLKYAKVALVPGSCFGQEGYVRLSYANSTANIRKAVARMKKFVNERS